MTSPSSHRPHSTKNILILVLCAVTARIICIWLWPPKAVSVDLLDWQIISSAMVLGVNPYAHLGRLLNWPPMWMECLYALGKISDRFDFQFFTCVRLFLTAADAALVLSAWSLLKLLGSTRAAFRPMLLGLCLNPFLLLLTVQQGNFDVIPTIGIVWFLFFLIRFRRSQDPTDWLCSATALGLAAFAKTFPWVLLPLLIASTRPLRWNARVLGAALAGGPCALSLAPLYVLFPAEIAQHVIAYRGTPGALGVSSILQLLWSYDTVTRYAPAFTIALLLSMAWVTAILWRRPLSRDIDMVLLVILLLMGVFLFGSGYCPQYWIWVAPFLIVSYVHAPRSFGIFLILASTIIVLTNILTFAYDAYLGSFIANAFPNSLNMHLQQVFSDVTHDLILISLPMTAVTLVLWLYCLRLILGSKTQAPIPVHQPATGAISET